MAKQWQNNGNAMAKQWQREREQKDNKRYTKHNIENQRPNNNVPYQTPR